MATKQTAATKTTVHPDDALITAYQAAQDAIQAYTGRLQAITAALQAQATQPTPDALEAAKGRINDFLEKEYPNKSARRGVMVDIDLGGYTFAVQDVGDVSPAMFDLAQKEIDGRIVVGGDEALYASIVDYVCTARDEDGAPVLLQYQQDAVRNIFFPPAAVQQAKKVKKNVVEGAQKNTQSIAVKVCIWPGTTISAKVSEFANGDIRVQGRGKSNLMAALAAVGINVSKTDVDKTMRDVYMAT